MDCGKLFSFVSMFKDKNKTDIKIETKELGLLMYGLIEKFNGSDTYKNLLLVDYNKLSFYRVIFIDSAVIIKIKISDPTYKFIKIFKFEICGKTTWENESKLFFEYGLFGKNGRKLSVVEETLQYDYDTAMRYIKPITDVFCEDKI